jgi:hypothetical protein
MKTPRLKKTKKLDDPRIAISKHISWVRPTAYETEYAVPEPDDYNYAVCGTKPIECQFVKDQVFYKQKDNMWWSVYCVPVEQRTEFLTWLEKQQFEVYWCSSRNVNLRKRRPMLYARKNQPDLTLNERLFAMGYFTNLSSKYFSEDDTMLLERLGPARAEVFDDFSENH